MRLLKPQRSTCMVLTTHNREKLICLISVIMFKLNSDDILIGPIEKVKCECFLLSVSTLNTTNLNS